ncbi:MAG: hypothetical protein IKE90_02010 [Bacilli bacterium]|nr:hypothetical protein [Bacilli bacterium]
MIFFYISLITYYIYTILKYKKTLILLQEANYNSKKYKKSLNKSLFINKELIIIILIIIALNFDIKTIEISTILVYTLLELTKTKDKTKLKKENKIIIRIIPLVIIYILLNVWFILDYKSFHETKGLIFDNSAIYYIILYIFTYISYLVTLIINNVVKPLDKLLK